MITGAFWKWKIGELNIEVKVPVETIEYILPKGYTRTRGVIKWQLKDYEPKDELVIVFSLMESRRYLSAYNAYSIKPSRKFLKIKNSLKPNIKLLNEIAENFDDKKKYEFEIGPITKMRSFPPFFSWIKKSPEINEITNCLKESAKIIKEEIEFISKQK